MKNIEFIIKSLEDEGYETYLVGGCVRDKIMGKEKSDYDLTTIARPNEIKEVFKDLNTIDIGKKYGTIKVLKDNEEFEITTFRSDLSYIDRRHPDKIRFSNDILEDLQRRDFTINSMAIRNGKLIDPFDGRADIEKKIIRAVGNPDTRMKEDYLRALRALRFATTLNFSIDKDLLIAIRDNKSDIEYISKERIREELNKILLSDRPSYGIKLLRKVELLEYILPELDRTYGFDQHSTFHSDDVYNHNLKVMDKTKKDLITRIAGLYHDVGKVDTFFIDENGEGRFFSHQKVSSDLLKKRLKELRYPKDIIESSSKLIERHMDNMNTYTKKSIRKLLRRLGEEDLYRLFDLQKADVLSTKLKDTSNIENGKEILQEVLKENIPLTRNGLKINGNDLKALGYKEGKELGEVLNMLSDMVLEEKIENDKKELINFVKSLTN